MFETLEARVFLSVTTAWKDGTLVINGTSGDDQIEVGMSFIMSGRSASVFANGETIFSAETTGFPTRFLIRGRGGNDSLSVHQEWGAAAGTVIRGGGGDDEIHVSSMGGFATEIWGNGGNDKIEFGFIYTWSTSPIVHGGAGDDVIIYGAITDPVNQIFAAPATIFGDAGNDRITGGDANDKLSGGAGRDTLVGGKGDDQLIGGAGKDRLLGGAGRNTLRRD